MAQKSLSHFDVRELRKLVDHEHPEISISRQCALLGLARSTLYNRPIPMRESTLRIMAKIDVFYLARDGIPISLDRVQPYAVHGITGDLAGKFLMPDSK
jgi:putative transposase